MVMVVGEWVVNRVVGEEVQVDPALLLRQLPPRGGHPDPLIAEGGCRQLKSVNISGLVYKVADVARMPTDARRNHPDVTDLA